MRVNPSVWARETVGPRESNPSEVKLAFKATRRVTRGLGYHASRSGMRPL